MQTTGSTCFYNTRQIIHFFFPPLLAHSFFSLSLSLSLSRSSLASFQLSSLQPSSIMELQFLHFPPLPLLSSPPASSHPLFTHPHIPPHSLLHVRVKHPALFHLHILPLCLSVSLSVYLSLSPLLSSPPLS